MNRLLRVKKQALPLLSMSDRGFAAFVVTVYLGLGILGMLHHEMWFDELQSWSIARDSVSIPALIHNIRYEGHPALWYLCLHFLSHISRSPVIMQGFHLGIATGSVFLFVRYAPFSRLQKGLFAFGYFPFYEYALISRNYALGMLLIFSVCCLLRQAKRRYFALFGLLGLLANTNVYSLILAIAFALTCLFDDRWRRSSHPNRPQGDPWGFWGGGLIFGASVLGALYQIMPPPDRGFGWSNNSVTAVAPFSQSRFNELATQGLHLAKTLATLWEAYVPVTDFGRYSFWSAHQSTNIAVILPLPLQVCIVFISIALFGFFAVCLRRSPTALWLYLCGTGGLLLFSHFIFGGLTRHHGHLWLLLLACFWIAEQPQLPQLPRRNSLRPHLRRYQSVVITLLLSLNVLAGLYAYGRDWVDPFSATRKAVAYIQSQSWDHLQVVVSPDYPLSGLAAYLDRPLYYPEKGGTGTFIIWNKQRRSVDDIELLSHLERLIQDQRQTLLLVTDRSLNLKTPTLQIQEQAKFTQSIVEAEQYFVHLVHPQDRP